MISNLDFQWISLYAFIIILSIVAYKNRSKMEIQGLIPPILYLGLFRTKFGINFIEKISKKHGEFIKIIGLSSIGFGFVGMILIIYAMIQAVFLFISKPSTDLVKPLLPQTNYPGLGFLSFWHFIICLFLVILIHEFSHAIVARANGIKVKNSGVGFMAIILPIFPLAFVEPDLKEMDKSPDHVKYSILSAGPFSNIITAAIVLILFAFVLTPVDGLMMEKDGLSFQSINESYPSSILPDNFTLRKMNGENIMDLNSFVNKMSFVSPGDSINLSDGKNYYLLTTVENPNNSESAFIGIHNFVNEIKLKEGVNEILYNIYWWVRGLLIWLGQISLAVGLMNLLPMSITDGGQMFNLMFSKIFKNKEKSKKWATFISLIFIGIILLFLAYWLLSTGVTILGKVVGLF